MGDPDGFDDVGSVGDPTTSRRRKRVKYALASLPLLLAATLFAVTSLQPPEPDVEPGTLPGQESTDPDLAAVAPPVPGLAGPGVPSTVPAPGLSAVGPSLPGSPASADAPAGTVLDGAPPSAAPVPSGAAPAPEAPAGFRPVAVRIADPAALSLVDADDRVDVVGMDGSVLAEDVAVLQDRSSGQGAVLVLSVPSADGPGLAAAALAREVTVILAPADP